MNYTPGWHQFKTGTSVSVNPPIRPSKKPLAEIRLAKIYFLKWTDTRIHGFLPLLSTESVNPCIRPFEKINFCQPYFR